MPENDFNWVPPDQNSSDSGQMPSFEPAVDTVDNTNVVAGENPDFTENPEFQDEAEKAKYEQEERDRKAKELKEKRDKEKEENLSKRQAILAEYDNKESEIPLSHDYWGLLNRYRSI